MEGILVEYEYDGDEEEWRRVISEFISAIQADARLRGKFEYTVCVGSHNNKRVHLGRWDAESTLEHLVASPFFKAFAEKIRGFAGESLTTTDFQYTVGSEG